MLRIIIVLSLIGAFKYQTCRGDTQTDDSRKQGFYRPRRNYPNQSQNDNSFQASHGQNYQSQNTFRSDFNQSPTRRSYSQNERNPFEINYQSTQNQNSFTSNPRQPQYAFGSGSQNSKAPDTSRTNFGQNQSQNVYGISKQNSQRQNSFGFWSQNSFRTEYIQKTGSQDQGSANQNSFAASFNQNEQGTENGQNTFGSSFSQPSYSAIKTNSQPFFGSYSQNTQNPFERSGNYHNSHISFGNVGQNVQGQKTFGSFQSQNSLSAFGSNSAFTNGDNYQGPGYLPAKRFKGPEYLPPKEPSTTSPATRRPTYNTTTTKRPFYTITTTRRPFYTTTATRRPFYTTTKRPTFTTTTKKRPIITTTTTIKPIYAPAMAMLVPPDDYYDDEIIPGIMMTTSDAALPAMAMQVPPDNDDDDGVKHGIVVMQTSAGAAMAKLVPPEPDDDDGEIFEDFTTSTKRPLLPPAPAMAMVVLPEQDDPATPATTIRTAPTTISTTPTTPTTPSTTSITTKSTTKTPSTITSTSSTIISPTTTTTTSRTSLTTTSTTPTTTPSATTSSTPSTTTSTTPSTSTHIPNRNLIEEESSPTTPPSETTAPSTTTFKAPEYLPPDNTTRKPITPVALPPPPSPAMGMRVPPEPECDPLDPSTYPSEVDQRYFGHSPCAPITTTLTTTSTTPTMTPSATTSSTPSTATSTTPPTTTHTPNRNVIEEKSSPTTPPSETTAPSTTTFKAPEYLPPDNTRKLVPPVALPPPPSPAMGMRVPPEPECDPLDPSTYPSEVDQRYFGHSPCAPTTTTTVKPPFRGPLYLPPPPDEPLCIPTKSRVRRSTEGTLRLGDLTGTPRPVWYAGIYEKVTDPYYPICGGSIVREDIVISAAHCFWDDVGGKKPAELFAVAARKIYKPWKDPMDKKAQKSDVSDISIPPRFLGAKASFQEDIAILKLATPFKYSRGVRPICVDFDVAFDRQQLKAGHYGTIAGWGYTDSKGTPSQRLLWLELPYIEIEKCIRDSDESFLKYITSDKVCAGENDTGKALCRGDSGGGLAFWQGPASHATPYLRGVASTAPTDNKAVCNVFAYGSFTWLYAHRTFLRDHVPEIEQCRFWE